MRMSRIKKPCIVTWSAIMKSLRWEHIRWLSGKGRINPKWKATFSRMRFVSGMQATLVPVLLFPQASALRATAQAKLSSWKNTKLLLAPYNSENER
jgi:hypothetical protein